MEGDPSAPPEWGTPEGGPGGPHQKAEAQVTPEFLSQDMRNGTEGREYGSHPQSVQRPRTHD